MTSDAATTVSVMDVGGTHVTAAQVEVAAGGLSLGPSFREPLDSAAGTDEFVAALVRCAGRLPGPAARHWTIALPGPFDYERGIGRYQGVGKFDALHGFDLRTALTDRLPGRPTLGFCNDADAFAYGEWQAGAARGHRTVAGLTLGTGVGSCFLREGGIVRQGPGIPPGGRIDLMEYQGRPLEETVSRRALRRAYAQDAGAQQEAGRSGEPDVREIAERARAGDGVAARVLTNAFHALGQALGPMLAAFAPDILVIGGSIATSWDLVAPPLREGIAGARHGDGRTVVAAAQLDWRAPLLGAAYLAATPVLAEAASRT
ncbi:ROK family protein [Streptacidiphilus sp. N1-10]|uniref:ROK family protein n=1 Tax=Streptacidiphilus jeojiensis TaxID=3229225 RepID=A0ABV6XGC8_9ACTN